MKFVYAHKIVDDPLCSLAARSAVIRGLCEDMQLHPDGDMRVPLELAERMPPDACSVLLRQTALIYETLPSAMLAAHFLMDDFEAWVRDADRQLAIPKFTLEHARAMVGLIVSACEPCAAAMALLLAKRVPHNPDPQDREAWFEHLACALDHLRGRGATQHQDGEYDVPYLSPFVVAMPSPWGRALRALSQCSLVTAQKMVSGLRRDFVHLYPKLRPPKRDAVDPAQVARLKLWQNALTAYTTGVLTTLLATNADGDPLTPDADALTRHFMAAVAGIPPALLALPGDLCTRVMRLTGDRPGHEFEKHFSAGHWFGAAVELGYADVAVQTWRQRIQPHLAKKFAPNVTQSADSKRPSYVRAVDQRRADAMVTEHQAKILLHAIERIQMKDRETLARVVNALLKQAVTQLAWQTWQQVYNALTYHRPTSLWKHAKTKQSFCALPPQYPGTLDVLRSIAEVIKVTERGLLTCVHWSLIQAQSTSSAMDKNGVAAWLLEACRKVHAETPLDKFCLYEWIQIGGKLHCKPLAEWALSCLD